MGARLGSSFECGLRQVFALNHADLGEILTVDYSNWLVVGIDDDEVVYVVSLKYFEGFCSQRATGDGNRLAGHDGFDGLLEKVGLVEDEASDVSVCENSAELTGCVC